MWEERSQNDSVVVRKKWPGRYQKADSHQEITLSCRPLILLLRMVKARSNLSPLQAFPPCSSFNFLIKNPSYLKLSTTYQDREEKNSSEILQNRTCIQRQKICIAVWLFTFLNLIVIVWHCVYLSWPCLDYFVCF